MASATITLFLTQGDAKSLRTAAIGNWSGKAIAAPRTEFDNLLKREELKLAGVYMLLGTDPTSGHATAYIGEAETIRTRLAGHRTREFVSAIVFVSEELTKAHAKYLEGKILTEAAHVGRAILQNTVRSSAKLPECDLADMDVFLSRIRQLLPVLGSDLLTPISPLRARDPSKILTCRMRDAEAHGERTSTGFVVFQGSTAVAQERAGAQKHKPHIVILRKQLRNDNILITKGNVLKFTKDVEFSSPSAAASVVCGGAAAGPLEWKDNAGKTLKELDEAATP